MLHMTPVITIFCTVFSFLLGAVFASFLGCMGWRIAKGESVWKGRSHCDFCGHVLGVFDLIPIISYLFAKGRCKYCGKTISKGHVIGEFLLGCLFVTTIWHYDISWKCLLMLSFICVLYFLSIVDLEVQIIPDQALLFAIIVRLIYEVVFVFGKGANIFKEIAGLLLDGCSVSLPLLILVLIVEKILKKEAMGGGDIKLLFVTGLYLGWMKNLLAVFIACIIGIVVGTIQQNKTAQNESTETIYFPFGPSIAAGAVLAMLVGDALLGWYLSLF